MVSFPQICDRNPQNDGGKFFNSEKYLYIVYLYICILFFLTNVKPRKKSARRQVSWCKARRHFYEHMHHGVSMSSGYGGSEHNLPRRTISQGGGEVGAAFTSERKFCSTFYFSSLGIINFPLIATKKNPRRRHSGRHGRPCFSYLSTFRTAEWCVSG